MGQSTLTARFRSLRQRKECPQKAAEGAKGGLRHRKDIRVRRAMSLNETLRG